MVQCHHAIAFIALNIKELNVLEPLTPKKIAAMMRLNLSLADLARYQWCTKSDLNENQDKKTDADETVLF